MTGWIYWIISALILIILMNQNELECQKTYVDDESSTKLIEFIKDTKIVVDTNKVENENIRRLLQNQKVLLDLKLNENDLNNETVNKIINKYC